jgi:hypothetical protein
MATRERMVAALGRRVSGMVASFDRIQVTVRT